MRKTFIPVSVRISRRDKRSDAMPNKPNWEGVKSLPKTASLRKVIPLVTPRSSVIHETPRSASLEYPIS